MDSYDVRFWDIKKLGNGTAARYRVRWAVDGREHCKSFKARPLADGFLDGLKDAVRDRRPVPLAAPAVERGPGHPQLGGHLLDRQQRVARGSGFVVRGGGGPAGSGHRSRGRPVRGPGSRDAPLRPPRQVRPPPGRRSAAVKGSRETEQRPRRGARRGTAGRGRPGRRGSPAGPGRPPGRTPAGAGLPSFPFPRSPRPPSVVAGRAGAGLDGAGGAERPSSRTHGRAAPGNANRSRPARRHPGRSTRNRG